MAAATNRGGASAGRGASFRNASGIDGSDKRRPALGRVVEGNFGSHRSAGGESDNADTIGRDAPFGRMLPDVGHCRQPIGDRQWLDGVQHLVKLRLVCIKQLEFLRRRPRLFAPADNVNTKAVTPFAARYLATSVPSLAMDRAIKPPPGQMTIAVPFFNSAEGLKTVSVGLGHVRNDFRFPALGEVLLLRVGGLGRAGCNAGIEGNDILRGCDGCER